MDLHNIHLRHALFCSLYDRDLILSFADAHVSRQKEHEEQHDKAHPTAKLESLLSLLPLKSLFLHLTCPYPEPLRTP